MKEQTISIKVLNELLSSETRSKYRKSSSKGHQGIGNDDYDGHQGEYNETFEFYQHPDMPANIFLRLTEHTDSYGDNESIVEYQFVEGKAKQVTVYEPIK